MQQITYVPTIQELNIYYAKINILSRAMLELQAKIKTISQEELLKLVYEVDTRVRNINEESSSNIVSIDGIEPDAIIFKTKQDRLVIYINCFTKLACLATASLELEDNLGDKIDQIMTYTLSQLGSINKDTGYYKSKMNSVDTSLQDKLDIAVKALSRLSKHMPSSSARQLASNTLTAIEGYPKSEKQVPPCVLASRDKHSRLLKAFDLDPSLSVTEVYKRNKMNAITISVLKGKLRDARESIEDKENSKIKVTFTGAIRDKHLELLSGFNLDRNLTMHDVYQGYAYTRLGYTNPDTKIDKLKSCQGDLSKSYGQIAGLRKEVAVLKKENDRLSVQVNEDKVNDFYKTREVNLNNHKEMLTKYGLEHSAYAEPEYVYKALKVADNKYYSDLANWNNLNCQYQDLKVELKNCKESNARTNDELSILRNEAQKFDRGYIELHKSREKVKQLEAQIDQEHLDSVFNVNIDKHKALLKKYELHNVKYDTPERVYESVRLLERIHSADCANWANLNAQYQRSKEDLKKQRDSKKYLVDGLYMGIAFAEIVSSKLQENPQEMYDYVKSDVRDRLIRLSSYQDKARKALD